MAAEIKIKFKAETFLPKNTAVREIRLTTAARTILGENPVTSKKPMIKVRDKTSFCYLENFLPSLPIARTRIVKL